MVFTAKVVVGPSTAIPIEGVFVELKLHEQPWSNPYDTAYTDAEGKAYLDISSDKFYDMRFSKEGFLTYIVVNAYLIDGGSTLVPLMPNTVPTTLTLNIDPADVAPSEPVTASGQLLPDIGLSMHIVLQKLNPYENLWEKIMDIYTIFDGTYELTLNAPTEVRQHSYRTIFEGIYVQGILYKPSMSAD